MALTLSECKFDYLIPPKDVLNVTHSDHYIRHGKGKGSVRTIFANQVYEEDELAKLTEFKAMIAKEKIELPEDWTELDTIRYMYTGKLDLKKSMKTLKLHLEWRTNPERGILNDKAMQYLTDGIIHLSGRDKQYRPIIIVNVHKIDTKKIEIKDFIDGLCLTLDLARKYCFVPGKVENWVIFIEINNTGLFSIPMKFIKSIIDVTSVNYTSCLDKLYILNPTSFLKRMWSFISAVIDSETAEKINFYKKSDFPKLLERISEDQLEQAYGGTLPVRETFWPPVNTLSGIPYTQEEEVREQAPIVQNLPSNIEESSKKMSFNPEISDTRNLSIRQSSTDEYNKLQSKNSEKFPTNLVEPIDINRKDSNKMFIGEEGQRVINKKSAEYQSSMKSSLPAETNNINADPLNDQQPQLDQVDGYEHTFGGNTSNRRIPGQDDQKTENQEYGGGGIVYEPQPQEEITDVLDVGGKKSHKNVHVSFGGVEVNEVSRVYSGRFGGNDDGTLFEKETVSSGFCGMCSNPNRSQKESNDGCNMF